MASMDVFKADAFSMMSMLDAIKSVDYKPQFLGSLGLFQPKPQRTRVVSVESVADTLALIQTTPIGAPLPQLSGDKRTLRNFNTVRLAKGSRINAEQVQGIRAFGSETELMQAQAEVATRLQGLMDDLELTWEYHRLGAVQGILLDADNSVIFNYFTEFGVAQPTEVVFDFSTLTAGEVRPKIEAEIVRPLIRAAKGAFTVGSRIVALVGDDFWDAFINHAEVRTTYLNHEQAAALREPTAFSTFRFAGVEWVNYRGTDDNSTVAIESSEAKFFPVGAPGIFQVAWGPSESMDAVNMPGRDVVPMVLPDTTGRNAFVDVEVYSYPLFICTRPLTLRSARMAT
jgi:hypothetical protein